MERRFELVKAMDLIIRSLNNEDGIEPWLMNGCPDESSDEDYISIAENADEVKELANLFCRLMRTYGKDGLYV